MSVAFLCPGQGAQSPGFLHRLPAAPEVEAALAEASAVLGRDAGDLDGEEALRSTVGVQLATVTAGVAVGRAIAARGGGPDLVAGLSVGAFTGAVLAGALRFEDALRLVRLRAEEMERAFPRGYGLVALAGLDERRVSALVAEAAAAGPAHLANLNAPAQFVVAGSEAALEELVRLALAAGARRAERMAVSVPSHCPLLDGVAAALEAALRGVPLTAPRAPWVTNRGARATRDPEDIRADLAWSVARPVRWHDATCVLRELGARLFVEVPPGRALTGLAEAAFPCLRAVAADEARLDSVAALVRRERGAGEA
ncbi:MAG TPA: malonate decarboxylase subunit epsilon [Anaeromyxobacteraceae bacterium]|nr:malonate decarboxylase subunit epsilon [Anaeromyxobacteraceae bacterium]